MNKIIYIFFISLFHFYIPSVQAQDQVALSNSFSSTKDLYESNKFETDDEDEHYLKPTAFIIPGSFLIYSGLKPFVDDIGKLDNRIMANIQKNYPNFHTNAADYLMWVPSASVYAMDALKVKTKHTFKQHLILDAGSILITGGIGYGMRLISKHIDAYNENGTKFPSGHAANAFRGAEIVHQELKDQSLVLSYSGYVVATGVGLLRIYNKNHLLTEVLAGAGLGILSTKLTYWIFHKTGLDQ
ncbi:MAG: phosphatase PAP2 family protein [Ginsengibacter sp.]